MCCLPPGREATRRGKGETDSIKVSLISSSPPLTSTDSSPSLIEEHAGIRGILLRREAESAGNGDTLVNLERHREELSKGDAVSDGGGQIELERADNPVMVAIGEES